MEILRMEVDMHQIHALPCKLWTRGEEVRAHLTPMWDEKLRDY